MQCYFEIFSSANGLTYLYHIAFIQNLLLSQPILLHAKSQSERKAAKILCVFAGLRDFA